MTDVGDDEKVDVDVRAVFSYPNHRRYEGKKH